MSDDSEQIARRWIEENVLGSGAELSVRRTDTDELGMTHVRFDQEIGGVPVFGGQGIVHLGPDGDVQGVTDDLVHDRHVGLHPTVSRADAVALAQADHPGDLVKASLVVLGHHHEPALVWWVRLSDLSEPSLPVRFVDAQTGRIVFRYDDLQSWKDRQTYTADNDYVLPGRLVRSEGQGPIGDPIVDDAHDFAGTTYDYYAQDQGRESFDGAGATIQSTAHFGVAYDNAFWDGSELVYGDGDNVTFGPFSTSLDVVAHELTHAVTQYTAGLVYFGESGGLNEATSDIFGAVVQSYSRGWAVDENIWEVGEDITLFAPALRYMDDPPKDGISIDDYADFQPYLDVHYSSGIGNKAFYLMATDPALDIQQAADLWYRALTLYMTPFTTFADARSDTVQAAIDLFCDGSDQVRAVERAWDAVGVFDWQVVDTWSGLDGTETTLEFDLPQDAPAIKVETTGGTGDVELLVKKGSQPTDADADCISATGGPDQSCEIRDAQACQYFITLRGSPEFDGIDVTASVAR